MILCDRCYQLGDYRKSVDQIQFRGSCEQFDLCESCTQTIRDICVGILDIDNLKEISDKNNSD